MDDKFVAQVVLIKLGVRYATPLLRGMNSMRDSSFCEVMACDVLLS
jgi:hypothetical protein